MKATIIGIVLLLAAHLPAVAQAEKKSTSSPTIPLLQFQSAPLSDAIANLARQAQLNYIFDTAFDGYFIEKDGKRVPAPIVTLRRENVTAEQALKDLLKEHGFELIENADTGVTRVAPKGQPRKTFDATLLGDLKANPIPLMVIDGAPLEDALRNLAAKVDPKIEVDLAMQPRPGTFPQMRNVSFRWESISVKQAIAALGENYGLKLEKDAQSGGLRLKRRD